MLVLFALALPLLAPSPSAPSPQYGVSAIEIRDGYPIFTVAGRPFFIWGAAFFYERIPRTQWRSALLALRGLHVNTLDLYVPWNWHEISDGDFDFTGRTNPQRDLRGLLRMARELGFYLVVRPGPVIRNEWRNGGYPAWLLERPEYGMRLHDVLEGRYPATATLQNAQSDDAAAEWLRNPTHLRYARRWLQHALAQLRPVADRVLAIQLDDDQGAYLTNQTWPAPHLRSYLLRLASIVRAATSFAVPVFINTYQMQVPGSSPVWTMGNWYQSDTFLFGEHDRAQLAFSTELLGTRPHQPIVLSEFQAGWLLAPQDIYPRRSDPSNTSLALFTAVAAGARGVIDFPMQDTLSPPGWEAPFANRFYAWDAALELDGKPSARYEPTLRFGELVARDGELLAQTHPAYDAAVVWWPSSVSVTRLSKADITAIADATLSALHQCRGRELSCALVDLRFASAAKLERYRALIVPPLPHDLHAGSFARERLAGYARRHPILQSLDGAAGKHLVAHRIVSGFAGATLHVGQRAGRVFAFLDAVNDRSKRVFADVAIRYPGISCDVRLQLRPRSAMLVRLGAPEAFGAPQKSTAFPRARGVPIRGNLDAPVSAVGSVVLENSRVRVVIAPAAGGRAFVFEDRAHHTSAFTTVGALRDDVSIQPPPSSTDRIAAYTHTFPAGTFNRPYAVTHRTIRSAQLAYTAPDVVPHGARFEKTASLPLDGNTLFVFERFVPGKGGRAQRLVVRSSLAIGKTDALPWQPPLILRSNQPLRAHRTLVLDARSPLALFAPDTHELVIVEWRPGDVEDARLVVEDRNAVLQLEYAPGTHTTSYTYTYVRDVTQARARLRAAAGEGR